MKVNMLIFLVLYIVSCNYSNENSKGDELWLTKCNNSYRLNLGDNPEFYGSLIMNDSLIYFRANCILIKKVKNTSTYKLSGYRFSKKDIFNNEKPIFINRNSHYSSLPNVIDLEEKNDTLHGRITSIVSVSNFEYCPFYKINP